MARIPYADVNREETRGLVKKIVAERGEVLHLYQMLMHSPPVAEGWLAFLTAIRQRSSLDPALRELVIIRIAQLNGAAYEAEQHIPIALKEGCSQAQIDALEVWQTAECFSLIEKAVLALTDEMTRNIHAPAALIDKLTGHFSHREMVELTATIGAYNMVSRFLEALAIHSSDARD